MSGVRCVGLAWVTPNQHHARSLTSCTLSILRQDISLPRLDCTLLNIMEQSRLHDSREGREVNLQRL